MACRFCEMIGDCERLENAPLPRGRCTCEDMDPIARAAELETIETIRRMWPTVEAGRFRG